MHVYKHYPKTVTDLWILPLGDVNNTFWTFPFSRGGLLRKSWKNLKAVLKCPLTGSKNFLRTYFLTKVRKIWIHNYWNENTHNDTFHFSVSVVELEFQQISFLTYHFFITFIWKLTQMLILTLFSRILSALAGKWKILSDFPL